MKLASMSTVLALASALVVLALLAEPTQAQYEGMPSDQNRPIVSRFRDLLSVNVPMFYDMVKQGNSMGINVLQGLVQVERGNEASRNGLEGPRPLSVSTGQVRVFGFPVYERGFRFREPSPVAPQSPGESAGEPEMGPNE